MYCLQCRGCCSAKRTCVAVMPTEYAAAEATTCAPKGRIFVHALTACFLVSSMISSPVKRLHHRGSTPMSTPPHTPCCILGAGDHTTGQHAGELRHHTAYALIAQHVPCIDWWGPWRQPTTFAAVLIQYGAPYPPQRSVAVVPAHISSRNSYKS